MHLGTVNLSTTKILHTLSEPLYGKALYILRGDNMIKGWLFELFWGVNPLGIGDGMGDGNPGHQ